MLSYLKRDFERSRLKLEVCASFLVCCFILLPCEFTFFTIQKRWIAEGVPMHNMATSLDAHIPFVPWLIWPYWFYFPFLGLAIWIVRNRMELLRTAFGFMSLHFTGFGLYLLYPTVMTRIEIPCDTLSCQWVGAMYVMDPGFGIFPSLHVAMSLFMVLTAFEYKSALRWPMTVFFGFIVAATVMVKQHYIIDIPPGFILGYVGHRWAGQAFDWITERTGFRIPDSVAQSTRAAH